MLQVGLLARAHRPPEGVAVGHQGWRNVFFFVALVVSFNMYLLYNISVSLQTATTSKYWITAARAPALAAPARALVQARA